ncbi:hypothetical protein [Nocardia stercoris]|uniref:Uncharacterized protein n=1 Tax=Nocardia stercoris TaxID=2483361 RepID=A0A3M2KT88_9NOCA|nr:hypothetical protein [Nocardia stercoris]RMI28669.1 hypothetical protein EBN03_28910 [Nocardia stercoris]
MNKIISGTGIGVMGLAAAAIAAAPMAAADVTNANLTVAGSQFVVNKSYSITANAQIPGVVTHFYDNGVEIGSVPTLLSQGSLGNVPVTISWTPTTTGSHVITEKNLDAILGTTLSSDGPVNVNVISQWDATVGGIPVIGPALGSLS